MVHLSVEERAEMIRGHVGVITALIHDDAAAVHSQVIALAAQQLEASDGSIREFAERMAKQVEAGARVTRQMVLMMAPRLGLTEAEVIKLVASVYHDAAFLDSLEE